MIVDECGMGRFVGDLPSVKGAQSKADESKPKDTSAVPLVTYEEKIQIQDQMRKVSL